MIYSKSMQGRRRCATALVAGVVGTLASAQSPSPGGPALGELLYATHCVACHSSQVHWRDKKLATNWSGLKAQVRRWETNIGLAWSDDEIAEVARYLNGRYYRFQEPDAVRTTSEASTRIRTSFRNAP